MPIKPDDFDPKPPPLNLPTPAIAILDDRGTELTRITGTITRAGREASFEGRLIIQNNGTSVVEIQILPAMSWMTFDEYFVILAPKEQRGVSYNVSYSSSMEIVKNADVVVTAGITGTPTSEVTTRLPVSVDIVQTREPKLSSLAKLVTAALLALIAWVVLGVSIIENWDTLKPPDGTTGPAVGRPTDQRTDRPVNPVPEPQTDQTTTRSTDQPTTGSTEQPTAKKDAKPDQDPDVALRPAPVDCVAPEGEVEVFDMSNPPQHLGKLLGVHEAPDCYYIIERLDGEPAARRPDEIMFRTN